MILQSGAEACNIYWAVGSSATLGTNSQIAGTIIANVSITANTGAVVNGRLFALTGAVTLDSNTIGATNCAPATTTTSTLAATTTSTAPATTTTTAPPATTTTTALPATTTTAALPATTTTTVLPATTTTTQVPVGTTTTQAPGATTTTLAPGTTTTTPASGTTTPAVGAGGAAPTTDQASPGATTTESPGAATASTGVPLFSVQAGLGAQNLARTGQGLNGPLSLAVVSIFLGALLLLAPRRGGVPAMAAPRPAALRHPLGHAATRLQAPTVVEGDRREVGPAPGAGQVIAEVKATHEPVGRVGARSPRADDPMDALERQLHEADARLKARYGGAWIGEAPESEN